MSALNPLDELLFIKVTVYTSGAMCVSGHIGDTQLCIDILQQALDRFRDAHKPEPLIVIPNREVHVKEYAHPVNPLGDMPRSKWGDR